MTPRQTSRPMKSASSSGPIGWLSPTLAPVSMSSAVPSPSSKARIASARNGMRIRLTMNPGRSADDDHLLAHVGGDRPDGCLGRIVGRREPRISSTSGITGTGLKKCIPTNRVRRSSSTAVASRSIEIDEVFVAKMAAAGARPSRSRPQARLDVDVLEHGLDDEVRVAAAARSSVAVIRAEDRRRPRRCQPAFRDRSFEVARDPRRGRPPLVRAPARRGRPAAGRRERLGNPVAHQPGAGDERALASIAHRTGSGQRGSPSARRQQLVGRGIGVEPVPGDLGQGPPCRSRSRSRSSVGPGAGPRRSPRPGPPPGRAARRRPPTARRSAARCRSSASRSSARRRRSTPS